MGFVICPECKKKVSQYAESCPECGFPIKKFILENNINNMDKVFICPVCAELYFGSKREYNPLYLRCEYCNTILVQTDEDEKNFYKFRLKKYEDEYKKISIETAKKYGNNQFSQEAYDNRINKIKKSVEEYKRQREQQNITNTPKCPKCGCTEFVPLRKKFSLLTGFATNKVEMVCKNCGAVKK